jgi:hypothetical protein
MVNSRRKRKAENVERMGETRNSKMFFVGMPEGKRPLGRP